jgi:hypothetical protein
MVQILCCFICNAKTKWNVKTLPEKRIFYIFYIKYGNIYVCVASYIIESNKTFEMVSNVW